MIIPRASVLARSLGSVAAYALLLCLSSTSHAAESARPSAATLFAPASFADAKLSPDGDCAAMLVRSTRDSYLKLIVMNLADMSEKVVASSPDTNITDIHWVNNQRLVFSTSDVGVVGEGDMEHWPGLFAVNRDGSEMVKLVERGGAGGMLQGNTHFLSTIAGKGSDIFVVQPVYSNLGEFKALNLLRVNTRTGHAVSYQRPGNTEQWLLDQAGVPRINVTEEDGKTAIYYFPPGEEKWKMIAEFDTFGTDEAFAPEYFDGDGKLYVSASKGKDTESIYRYDLVSNKIADKPFIAIDGYDFEGRLIADAAHKQLLGVQYVTDAESTLWFDDERKKIQQAIDAKLPATNNFLQFAGTGQIRYVLVAARSDLQPGLYMIYDVTSGELTKLGEAHPQVDPAQMSHQVMVHYAARDGLTIPAYLTLPRGAPKKNLPLVVLVHGGPYVRGATWGWDPSVQFLASRGYAVLQPEFRGSTGFGKKFTMAGWKQWGLAMQDDVADGAKWAIAQGIADPKRICIAGASYGGYATLMGLANDPDIFKCGVDWVGVADINLMYKADWANDMSVEWQHYGMPLLIGDPVKDAEQLRKTSPVNIADRIRQPVLMAYGGSDRRVPIEHGQKFRDAVRKVNDKVEWVEYPEEGHGWRLLKNNIDFWTRVEKFLDENIGH